MGTKLSKFGDWTKAGLILQAICQNLTPNFIAQINEDGDLFLKSVVDHIDNQDLGWVPLAESTIEAKNGDTTVYVETGYLRDHLRVRKIRAPKNGYTLFVGADAWTTTPDGTKLGDILVWLEYGTDSIPPRPLIRPTWDEIEPIIKKNWQLLMQNVVKTGGA